MSSVLAAAPPAKLTPRAFVPLAAAMFATFAALITQQVLIDAAQNWRER